MFRQEVFTFVLFPLQKTILLEATVLDLLFILIYNSLEIRGLRFSEWRLSSHGKRVNRAQETIGEE